MQYDLAVELFAGLLLISCAVAIAVKRVRLPYTIALVLCGLVIAMIPRLTGVTFPLEGAVLTSDLVFYLILPPLLFQGALNMQLDALRRNYRVILLLAIPGVLISTFAVGGMLYAASSGLGWGLGLGDCLLFGALIAPTDPISVLAIFKKIGVPGRLKVVVEGESLFNDGTGVVIFTIIASIIVSKHASHGALLESLGVEGGWAGIFGIGADPLYNTGAGIVIFFIVAGAGAALGYALGTGANRVLRPLHDKSLEVTITIVLAFGAFILAEALAFSGVIAVVIAGLLVGNFGKNESMSDETVNTVETFWDSIDFILNSILFLLIGLELQAVDTTRTGLDMYIPAAVLITIAVVLLARALAVVPVLYLKRKAGRPLPRKWTPVIIWGGLKGSIPLALVLGLSGFYPYYDTFLILAFGVVLFSLVIQGLTMGPMLKYLGIGEDGDGAGDAGEAGAGPGNDADSSSE